MQQLGIPPDTLLGLTVTAASPVLIYQVAIPHLANSPSYDAQSG
jgi:hypothetical protein